MLLQWGLLLLVTIVTSASCGSSGDSRAGRTTAPTIELRVVQEKESCRPDCEQIEFDSMMLGRMTLWVEPRPDLVLSREDIVSISPVQLSAMSAEHPKTSVWSGTLRLTPEAAGRLRNLGSDLPADALVLISADGEPLSVSYAHWLGQMMGLGEFPSREELKESLGQYAEVEQGTGERVEVFSPEEIEAMRRRQQVIEQSEKMQAETEKIKKLAEEGKISRAEMIKRLVELSSETANQ